MTKPPSASDDLGLVAKLYRLAELAFDDRSGIRIGEAAVEVVQVASMGAATVQTVEPVSTPSWVSLTLTCQVSFGILAGV